MEPQADRWNDLRTRAISSAALALLALACVWIGGVVFGAFIILAAILMKKEWDNLTENQEEVLHLAGYAYITIPCACILWLRDITCTQDAELGFKLVLALVAVISATDTGAYFTGKRFGTNKLWPAISPNKTWEGLAGGVAAATVTGLLFAPYINVQESLLAAVFISPVIAVIAQTGDLFKSWIKRKAGVKDSGTLIPGHGGLLDRLDGYMFAAPVLTLIIYFLLKVS